MPYCVVATITYGKLPVNGVNLDVSGVQNGYSIVTATTEQC